MASIALDRGDVIVGVDTHKDQHVAVAIDGVGGLIDEPKFFDANNDGYAELLAWARSLGTVHVFAVEGCGSYGIGLVRFLRRHGHLPVEVSRPPRAGARRMSGKSDAIDAEHAARTALAGVGVVTPKLADGQVEAIRLVKIARDTAVKAHTTAMITLKAVLVTADQDLRDQLEALSDFKLVAACSELDASADLADPAVAMRHTLASLARRWFDLHAEIKTHSKQLKALTRAAAPELLDAFGVAVDIAAQMLITAGDNADRVRSETAFAKMCGVAPFPTGSGKTSDTDSTGVGTAKPTLRSTGPSSSDCGGTRRPSLTSSDAPLTGSRTRRSSDASSATSPENCSSCSLTSALSKHRPQPREPRRST